MSHPEAYRVPVTFREVTACFSENEWKLLHDWQNELYKNLMKEIHQALISLGPVVAASIFSLRAEESEDECPVDGQCSERGNFDNHSAGNDVTKVTSASFKEEETADLRRHQDSKDMPNKRCPAVIDATEVITSASIKEEKEADPPVYQDSNELQGMSCPTGPVVASAIFSLRPKEIEDECPVDEQCSARGIFDNHSTGNDVTKVTSNSFKEEEKDDFMGHQDSMNMPNKHCPSVSPIGLSDGEQAGGNMSSDNNVTVAGEGRIIKEDTVTNSTTHEDHMERESVHWLDDITTIEGCSTDNQQAETKGNLDNPVAHKSDTESKNENNVRTCTACKQHFTYDLDLIQGTNGNGEHFCCAACKQAITNKAPLLVHQKPSSRLKLFSCTKCEKSFLNKKSLSFHQLIHSTVKPFTCNECEKSFTWKAHLIIHQRIHSGEKPFSCMECDKNFNQKSNLMQHQRTHSGVKPFSCSECGKTFTRKTSLLTHQRIHSGVKPFSCSECAKTFTLKSHLLNHQSIHSGVRHCPAISVKRV